MLVGSSTRRSPDNPPLRGTSPEEFQAWNHCVQVIIQGIKSAPSAFPSWDDLYMQLMGCASRGVEATYVQAGSDAAYYLAKIRETKLTESVMANKTAEQWVRALLAELQKKFGCDRPDVNLRRLKNERCPPGESPTRFAQDWMARFTKLPNSLRAALGARHWLCFPRIGV